MDNDEMDAVTDSDDEQTSVADDIAAAIAEAKGEDTDDDTSDDDEPTADADDTEADDDSDDAADDDQPSEDASDDTTDDDVEDTGDDEDTETVVAPEHWPQADKDRFDKLNADDQAWWLDKVKSVERGYDEKYEQLGEARREGAALKEIFAPYQQQMAAAGVDRVGMVRRLVSAEVMLRSDPAEAFAQLVRTYQPQDPQAAVQKFAQALGVDIGGLSEGQADGEYSDPALSEVKRLEQKFDQRFQDQDTAAAQARQSQVDSAIQQFRDAKDDQGNARHPHFDKVQGQMAALIQSGAAADMEAAYDQAVWAHPELRNDLRKQDKVAVAEKANVERKKSVAKAKAASRKPKTDTAPARKVKDSRGPKTVDDAIMEAIEESRAA